MAEHSRHTPRFLGDAHLKVSFHQAMQRLRHMARRLVIFDDKLIAVDRRDHLSSALIEAPDIHLLAGKVIVRQIEL